MGRNLQPLAGSGAARTSVERESYLVLILVALYTYHNGLICEESMRSNVGQLIRNYTSHKTWRIEGARYSKFAVTWASSAALKQILECSKTEGLQVDHAVPVETIITDLLSVFGNAAKTNPYRSRRNLSNKTRDLAIEIQDRTLLVWVTRSEHAGLPEKMPMNWRTKPSRFDEPKLARYEDFPIDLRKDDRLIDHVPVFGAADKYMP